MTEQSIAEPSKYERIKSQFLAVLTAGVITLYIVVALVALVLGHMDFKDFSATVSPWGVMLLGYWVS